MTRVIPADILAALTSGSFRPIFLFDFEFDSPNQLYLCTEVSPITVGATLYLGAGDLISIGNIVEASDGRSTQFTARLSKINQTIADLAMLEDYQWRSFTYSMTIPGSSNKLTLFSGYIDRLVPVVDGQMSYIDLYAESDLINFHRSRPTYNTPATLQRDYPTDTFFNFTNGGL